jgi:hypothetical protein
MIITLESLFAVAWPQQQPVRGPRRNTGLAMDRQGRNTPTEATHDVASLHRVARRAFA